MVTRTKFAATKKTAAKRKAGAQGRRVKDPVVLSDASNLPPINDHIERIVRSKPELWQRLADS